MEATNRSPWLGLGHVKLAQRVDAPLLDLRRGLTPAHWSSRALIRRIRCGVVSLGDGDPWCRLRPTGALGEPALLDRDVCSTGPIVLDYVEDSKQLAGAGG